MAGYVARYERTTTSEVCNHTVADQAYNNSDNSLYQKAKEVCSQTQQIACNPYVYGTPNGSPTCVTPSRSDDNFQRATHWSGPCDSASRLQSSTSEIDILKDKTKTQGRYEDGNLLSEQERRELFKTDQGRENYKQTEDYLLGILKFRGKVKSDAKSLFETDVMNDEILAQIKLDKLAFDNEIRQALASCKAESEASKTQRVTHEKNYWQACDQLHRRHAFITELFTTKCESKTLNEETLKCKCAPPATNEVLPGAKCAAVNPPTPAVAVSTDATPARASQDVTESVNCDAKYPGAGVTGPKCLCANGNSPVLDVTDAATGAESWSCKDKPNRPTKPEEQCGTFCKIWKAIKTPLLWIAGGIAAYFIGKKIIEFMAPKKPTLASAPDRCPDGSTPPCGQLCTPPLKRQANGTCSCDGCPPGQTANPTTCYCSTGNGNTGTTTYLCPDGQTRKANLDECPTFPCWNGQSYQNPMNCPTQTPNTNNSNNGNTR